MSQIGAINGIRNHRNHVEPVPLVPALGPQRLEHVFHFHHYRGPFVPGVNQAIPRRRKRVVGPAGELVSTGHREIEQCRECAGG